MRTIIDRSLSPHTNMIALAPVRLEHRIIHEPTALWRSRYPFHGIWQIIPRVTKVFCNQRTRYEGPTADEGGGTSMAFFNMEAGDAPLLKRLADAYTISDNFHQPAMGGTG